MMSPIPSESQTQKPGPSESAKVDPERWVEEYGDVLFGFVTARVRDRVIAQDLVQETFLAALRARSAFAGRSTERAWLFGILRNKLVDYYRTQNREVAMTDLEPALPEEQGLFGETGAGKDGWLMKMAPKAWQTPDRDLVSKEVQDVLKGCLATLPEKVAQVFLLREIDGVSSEEICKDLEVSPNNLWVMLHRARMGLRRCLEARWFETRRTDK
jgi:RNA polymerase sigma-70 factor (ECF subfamily)